MQKSLVSILFLLTLLPASRAQLSWNTRQLDFAPQPLELSVAGEFSVENRRDYPVKIVSVQASCGCTVAKPSVDTLAPGAHATLSVQVDLTNIQGFAQRFVIVKTDDKNDPFAQLAIRIESPIVLTPSQKELVWHLGSEITHQPISFATTDGATVTAVQIEPLRTAFIFSDDPDQPEGTGVRFKPSIYAKNPMDDIARINVTVSHRGTTRRFGIPVALHLQ